MKVKKILFWGFTLLLFFQSTYLICNPKIIDTSENDQEKKVIIRFKKSIKGYSLSNLFSNIEYIVLETKKNCLVGEISGIKITDYKIYILDKYSAKGLLVFDRATGKYLFGIKATGSGPGEYDFPYDFTVNPVSGEINIIGTNKILFFNPEGKYIKEKRLDFYATNVKTDGQGLYVFVGSGNAPELIVTDESFRRETTYFNKTDKSLRAFSASFRLQYLGDKGIFYWRVFDNTLYKVNKNSINKFIKLRFPDANNIESIIQTAMKNSGIRNSTLDQILTKYGGVNVNGIFFGKDIALIGVYYQKTPYLSFVDLSTGKYKVLDYNSIDDDISGNIDNIYIHTVTLNDEVVFSLQPFDISDHSNEELIRIGQTIEKDSNPIIMIGKLKKYE
jgi:hypothetical protein